LEVRGQRWVVGGERVQEGGDEGPLGETKDRYAGGRRKGCDPPWLGEGRDWRQKLQRKVKTKGRWLVRFMKPCPSRTKTFQA
jgi:hypothetical protein